MYHIVYLYILRGRRGRDRMAVGFTNYLRNQWGDKTFSNFFYNNNLFKISCLLTYLFYIYTMMYTCTYNVCCRHIIRDLECLMFTLLQLSCLDVIL
jgi:hypothetical protein